jgi:hypothetical protein
MGDYRSRQRRCGYCREVKELADFPSKPYGHRIGLICLGCMAAGHTHVLVHGNTKLTRDNPTAPLSKFTYTNSRLVDQSIVAPLALVFNQIRGSDR